MKFVICLLVLLPLAMSRTIEIDERFLFGQGLPSLNSVTDTLVSALGSDTTEAACEAACPNVLATIPGGSLAASLLCHPACVELQHLAQG